MEFINVLNEVGSLCKGGEGGTKDLFIFIGNIVTAFKIIIPILLIVFGSIDLSKAVIASKEDDIKKAQSTLMKRAIVAVVIFFLPSIVSMIINLTGKADANTACWDCVVNPGGEKCNGSAYDDVNNATELAITAVKNFK